MSLAEKLADLDNPTFRCKFGRALDQARDVEPEPVAVLEQRIEAGTLTPTEMASILSDEGYRVSSSVALRHYGGRCGCTS